MIEFYAAQQDAIEARLVIRPNRASAIGPLAAFFALLTVACGAVAGCSWLQGNVFAPLFAVVDLGWLFVCQWLVRRSGRQAEVIAVSPARIAVHRLPGLSETFRGHPLWVRLVERQGHLLLLAGRRRVEVGAALGEAERQALAARLEKLLEWAVRAARAAG